MSKISNTFKDQYADLLSSTYGKTYTVTTPGANVWVDPVSWDTFPGHTTKAPIQPIARFALGDRVRFIAENKWNLRSGPIIGTRTKHGRLAYDVAYGTGGMSWWAYDDELALDDSYVRPSSIGNLKYREPLPLP